MITRPEEQALEPRRLRRVLVGRPMQTGQMHETLLPKWLALPIFASDPLSSVAYATESALVVLVAASATAAYLVFPLGFNNAFVKFVFSRADLRVDTALVTPTAGIPVTYDEAKSHMTAGRLRIGFAF